MRKLILSVGGALVVGLMIVATAVAAGPYGRGGGGQDSVVPSVLGITQAEVRELRRDGLSLAQIAEQRDVDPQLLVDALQARWAERIEARVATGALSTTEATQLKSQLELRAKDMVNKTTTGGMQGVAVGAGHGRMGAGAGPMGQGAGPMGQGAGPMGQGAGRGACDGTGPQGQGRP